MVNKIIVLLKTIGRKWFLFLVVAILIIALYNQIAAIVITIISIGLFILSYIPGLYFKHKLIKFMKEYYRIEDTAIAKFFNKPIEKIQNKMYNLSQKQVKKGWLIIFLDKIRNIIFKKSQKPVKREWLMIFLEKHYIFYHTITIEKFKELYNKGYGDKEILENLKEYELKSRAEIKIITETLIKYEKLTERDISVKEHEEKKRFESL
jgi:hypothetical protein